jgi:DinB superfamily
MSAYDIYSDFAELNRHWDAVQEILDDEAYCAVKAESVSGWDCGEHAGHIVLTLGALAAGIRNNLDHPDDNKDEPHAEFMPKVFDEGAIPRGAGQAPDFIDPKGHTREEFLTMLGSVREVWADLESHADELNECPSKFPHFAFGHLTSAEWVRFVSMHTLHHLYIIRDILAVDTTGGHAFGNSLKV